MRFRSAFRWTNGSWRVATSRQEHCPPYAFELVAIGVSNQLLIEVLYELREVGAHDADIRRLAL